MPQVPTRLSDSQSPSLLCIQGYGLSILSTTIFQKFFSLTQNSPTLEYSRSYTPVSLLLLESIEMISSRDQYRPRSGSNSKITADDLDHITVIEKITGGDLNGKIKMKQVILIFSTQDRDLYSNQ